MKVIFIVSALAAHLCLPAMATPAAPAAVILIGPLTLLALASGMHMRV